MSERSALILAGGRSTRFGATDKAVAELAGTPMIRHIADRIEPVVDALVVNCRDEQVASIRKALVGYDIGVRFVRDEIPDQGPMAGIAAGLRAVEHEYAFVAACDIPLIEPTVVAYLFERATGEESTDSRAHDAVVPQIDDGWLQTTHAVYRVAAMADACEAALSRDERRVSVTLSALDCVVVDEEAICEHGSLDTFVNVNTRAEFAAVEKRFR